MTRNYGFNSGRAGIISGRAVLQGNKTDSQQKKFESATTARHNQRKQAIEHKLIELADNWKFRPQINLKNLTHAQARILSMNMFLMILAALAGAQDPQSKAILNDTRSQGFDPNLNPDKLAELSAKNDIDDLNQAAEIYGDDFNYADTVAEKLSGFDYPVSLVNTALAVARNLRDSTLGTLADTALTGLLFTNKHGRMALAARGGVSAAPIGLTTRSASKTVEPIPAPTKVRRAPPPPPPPPPPPTTSTSTTKTTTTTSTSTTPSTSTNPQTTTSTTTTTTKPTTSTSTSTPTTTQTTTITTTKPTTITTLSGTTVTTPGTTTAEFSDSTTLSTSTGTTTSTKTASITMQEPTTSTITTPIVTSTTLSTSSSETSAQGTTSSSLSTTTSYSPSQTPGNTTITSTTTRPTSTKTATTTTMTIVVSSTGSVLSTTKNETVIDTTTGETIRNTTLPVSTSELTTTIAASTQLATTTPFPATTTTTRTQQDARGGSGGDNSGIIYGAGAAAGAVIVFLGILKRKSLKTFAKNLFGCTDQVIDDAETIVAAQELRTTQESQVTKRHLEFIGEVSPNAPQDENSDDIIQEKCRIATALIKIGIPLTAHNFRTALRIYQEEAGISTNSSLPRAFRFANATPEQKLYYCEQAFATVFASRQNLVDAICTFNRRYGADYQQKTLVEEHPQEALYIIKEGQRKPSPLYLCLRNGTRLLEFNEGATYEPNYASEEDTQREASLIVNDLLPTRPELAKAKQEEVLEEPLYAETDLDYYAEPNNPAEVTVQTESVQPYLSDAAARAADQPIYAAATNEYYDEATMMESQNYDFAQIFAGRGIGRNTIDIRPYTGNAKYTNATEGYALSDDFDPNMMDMITMMESETDREATMTSLTEMNDQDGLVSKALKNELNNFLLEYIKAKNAREGFYSIFQKEKTYNTYEVPVANGTLYSNADEAFQNYADAKQGDEGAYGSLVSNPLTQTEAFPLQHSSKFRS